MNSSQNNFDVIIAGAGPAGASAAIHLAMGGLRVLLIEQKRFPRPKLCGEFISPECARHFKRLGVADEIFRSGGSAITRTIFFSSKGNSVSVPSEWFGAASCALGLSRAELDHLLLNRAKQLDVTVLQDCTVTGLVITNGTLKGVSVKSEAGPEEYFADLVIDATGRTRALVRRINQLSTRTKQHKAPFVAFKAHLRNARAQAGACEIYFYDGGYGGLNSIEGGLSNLCFIVSARVARANNADPERVMREVVMRNERAATTLKEAQAAQSWMAVSLEQFGRQTLVPIDGLLTAGDAAAFIDPFTGSGILMALESGELIATTILSHLMKACFSFARLADDYRAAHAKVFDSRLRMSALLRRAAFMPRLTAAAIFLSGNDWLRRMLTRATRGGPAGGPACFYKQGVK